MFWQTVSNILATDEDFYHLFCELDLSGWLLKLSRPIVFLTHISTFSNCRYYLDFWLAKHCYAVHRDIQGVTWVDDSKATNIEATCTGLMGLKGHKCVILLGGQAKVRLQSWFLDPFHFHHGLVTFGLHLQQNNKGTIIKNL